MEDFQIGVVKDVVVFAELALDRLEIIA